MDARGEEIGAFGRVLAAINSIPGGGVAKRAIEGTVAAGKGVGRLLKGTKNLDEVAEFAGTAVAKRPKTYQTYTKKNPETGEVYSGRTSGTGTPRQNVARRDAGHHKNNEGFGPAQLDKSSDNGAAIRGREQLNIEANGGAKSQGGTSGNAINGISEMNAKLKEYLDAAFEEFGN